LLRCIGLGGRMAEMRIGRRTRGIVSSYVVGCGFERFTNSSSVMDISA
jgi:hypothetical protein